MTQKNYFLSLRSSSLIKILIALSIVGILLLSSMFYLKYSLQKWGQENQLEVAIENIHLHWRPWGLPGISFAEVNITSKDPKTSYHQITSKNMFIRPSLFYLHEYNFFGAVDNLKIKLRNGNVIEGNKITGDIFYKNDVYKIKNFNLEPLHIKLTPAFITKADDNSPPKGGQLVMYQIKGEGIFSQQTQSLTLHLHIPKASLQMPEGKTYSIQTKGELKFLNSVSHKNSDDPGMRGSVNFVITNFSNFLRHLYQAKLISDIAKNFGHIMGHLIGHNISRGDLFSQKEETFKDPVSLDLNFKPDGIYIGPMKL